MYIKRISGAGTSKYEAWYILKYIAHNQYDHNTAFRLYDAQSLNSFFFSPAFAFISLASTHDDYFSLRHMCSRQKFMERSDNSVFKCFFSLGPNNADVNLWSGIEIIEFEYSNSLLKSN